MDERDLAIGIAAPKGLENDHSSNKEGELWKSELQHNVGIEPTQPYSYLPLLSDRTIRVIVLQPENDFDAPLQCGLEHIEIEDSAEPGREYEAVSYCWGEPIFTHTLLCDARLLIINPNVDALLRHLRRGDIPQRLWIDGVCINQRDLAEKTIQISMMHDIYFCAARVHVWLGIATESDVGAFTLIRKLAFLDRSPPDPRKDEVEKLLRRSGEYALFSIGALLARPWFTRRWVLQEIGLSHEALLHCGDLSMDMSFLLSGLQLLKDRIGNESFAKPSNLRELVRQAMTVCKCKRTERTVLQLLVLYKSSKCFDARDSIFSLFALTLGRDDLSVARETQQPSEEPPFYSPWLTNIELYQQRLRKDSAFVPSYDLSTIEVYSQFAMYCLLSQQYAYAQILCMALCFPCEGAASWVPDFRLAGQARGLERTEFMLLSNFLTTSWRPYSRSSRGSLFAGLDREIIPTSDKTGFWLEPGDWFTARKVGWTGRLLPKDSSRDTIIATLRHWLSPFVLETVCEHSIYFCSASRNSSLPEHQCRCREEEIWPYCHMAADVRPREPREYPNDLKSLVWFRVVVIDSAQRIDRSLSSRTIKWLRLSERTRFPSVSVAEFGIYIEAIALGLGKSGLIPLEILALFLGAAIKFLNSDSNLSVPKPDHGEWFHLEVSKRLGFLQLLTSDCPHTQLSVSHAWSLLFVERYDYDRGYSKKKDDLLTIEVDFSEGICNDLLSVARTQRFCVLLDEPLSHHHDHQIWRGPVQNQVPEGHASIMLVLGPLETRVGNIFTSLSLPEKKFETDRRRRSKSLPSSSSSSDYMSLLDGWQGSIASDDDDVHDAPDKDIQHPGGSADTQSEHPVLTTLLKRWRERDIRRLKTIGRASRWSSVFSRNGRLRESSPSPSSSGSRRREILVAPPEKCRHLSLILTPSGRRSLLPESLRYRKRYDVRRLDSDAERLESMDGHRILGEGFMPYAYTINGLQQWPVLINA